MYNVAIRYQVAKSMMNSVITRMAVLAVKVEVYQMVYRINLFDEIHLFRHEKLTKVFYVGDNTMDNLGTYMLVEGSKEPFTTWIPSFRGFLWTRFIPKEDLWRDYSIFNTGLGDIKSVRMEFPQYRDSGFVIERVGSEKIQNSKSWAEAKRSLKIQNLKFKLTSLSTNESVPYDTLKLLRYLSSFQNLKFEALINDIDAKRKDSIISSTPWHIITVTDLNGKRVQMKTFHKKPSYGNYYDDAIKQMVTSDRDRLYGLINEDKDFTLIQFFIFGNILKSINNFQK
jgi:hypothetical protein